MTKGNQTYLNDQSIGVTITSTQAQIGSTMYPIAGITAVSTGKTPASRGSPIVLAVLGVLSAAIGISTDSGVVLGTGALFAVIGGATAALAKDEYTLTISTAGGQVMALKSHNADDVARVSLALKQTIVDRG